MAADGAVVSNDSESDMESSDEITNKELLKAFPKTRVRKNKKKGGAAEETAAEEVGVTETPEAAAEEEAGLTMELPERSE